MERQEAGTRSAARRVDKEPVFSKSLVKFWRCRWSGSEQDTAALRMCSGEAYINPPHIDTIPSLTYSQQPYNNRSSHRMNNRAGQSPFFLIATVAFLAVAQSALAQFTFTTNNGAITITGYVGSNPSLTIPSTTNGFPVTTIGNAAFGGDAILTSVTLPNSVTNIGAFAFFGTGLTRITIPAGIIGIGDDAFNSCESLTNIIVNTTNRAFSSLNGVLFNKAQDTLLQYPAALTSGGYIVPGSVAAIAADAFYGASGLSSVTIPARVNNIGNDAFAECFALTSIYFSGNAPNLGSDAFDETDFGRGVTVYYVPGTTGWPGFSTALGQSLAALVLWYLPNPEIIGSGPSFGVHNAQFGFIISWATNATLVVDACSNLSNPVWLPVSTNTVTATNGTANFTDPKWSTFKNRFYRLQVAPLPFAYSTINGAITITGYTDSTPSVTIPATINGYPVVAIGNTAFGGDMSMTSVSIPSSVTNIGAFAFTSSGLTSVTIPASVIGIGQEAFISCDSLTNISVAAGDPAFSSVNGVLFDKAQDTLIQYPPASTISAYTLPASVNVINSYAFYGAINLTSVTIPKTVTSIGDDAFTYCVFLNTVYFGGNAPNIGGSVFYQTGFGAGVALYYLPGTTGWPNFLTALGDSLAFSSFWYQPGPAIVSFGQNGSQFGFTISWATNASVVVEANANPSDPAWVPVSTNSVIAAIGTVNFSDPQTKSHKQRYYRLRTP